MFALRSVAENFCRPVDNSEAAYPVIRINAESVPTLQNFSFAHKKAPSTVSRRGGKNQALNR